MCKIILYSIKLNIELFVEFLLLVYKPLSYLDICIKQQKVVFLCKLKIKDYWCIKILIGTSTLHYIDLNFLGQTFLVYEITIKLMEWTQFLKWLKTFCLINLNLRILT